MSPVQHHDIQRLAADRMEKLNLQKSKIFVDQHDINWIAAESISIKSNHLNDNKSLDKIGLKREEERRPPGRMEFEGRNQ